MTKIDKLKLFYDNDSTVMYSYDNRSNTKSKHVDVKVLIVKERVHSGQILIEYIKNKLYDDRSID